MNIIEMPLEPRICECCGNTDLESVWTNESVVTKASASYRFKVFTVVCKKCGFCFSSPVYTNDSLSNYYADSLSRSKDIMLPYSIEPRVAFLKKYSVPNGILAEIGGDQANEFQCSLNGLFAKVINIELTANSGADYISIHDVPSNYVDIITHYDVLEHVPKLMEFLTVCKDILKNNGLMICEVPDIRLYPRNLLLLEYEHVNHFSVSTLSTIAAQCGLELLEVEHICSRPFGFVAAFRKRDMASLNQTIDMPFEYIDAQSCIQGAIYQVENVCEHIKSIQDKIAKVAKQGNKITLWCVTDLLHRLIKNYELPKYAIVVDTDPRRQTHLNRYGLEVFQPNNQISHINNSELLVICAPRYKEDILNWIYKSTGKRFSGSELEVMGTGPSGESLL
jgi:hypothetical protein